jgi:hypothetical protein
MAYGKLPTLSSQNFQQNLGLSGFMKVRLVRLSLCFKHLTMLYTFLYMLYMLMIY